MMDYRLEGMAQLMARCAGTKQDGTRCAATVQPPQRFYWWHDPANSEQRNRLHRGAVEARVPPRQAIPMP